MERSFSYITCVTHELTRFNGSLSVINSTLLYPPHTDSKIAIVLMYVFIYLGILDQAEGFTYPYIRESRLYFGSTCEFTPTGENLGWLDSKDYANSQEGRRSI